VGGLRCGIYSETFKFGAQFRSLARDRLSQRHFFNNVEP
jgi:hypothetical protein